MKFIVQCVYSVYKYPDNRSAIAFLVEVPSKHTVRVNITLSEDILNIIDRRARGLHLSRSAFLAEAALNYGKYFRNNSKRV